MAKKACVELSCKELFFVENGVRYELLRYDPNRMSIHCKRTENGTSQAFVLPFAHLPKRLKKILKPL